MKQWLSIGLAVMVIAILVVAVAWMSLPPSEPNPLLEALRTPVATP